MSLKDKVKRMHKKLPAQPETIVVAWIDGEGEAWYGLRLDPDSGRRRGSVSEWSAAELQALGRGSEASRLPG